MYPSLGTPDLGESQTSRQLTKINYVGKNSLQGLL